MSEIDAYLDLIGEVAEINIEAAMKLRNRLYSEDITYFSCCLIDTFDWEKSIEGFVYWYQIYDKLSAFYR